MAAVAAMAAAACMTLLASHSFVEGGVGRCRERFADEIARVDASAAQIVQTAHVIHDTADVGSYDVGDGAKGRFGGDAGDEAAGGVLLGHVIRLFEPGEFATLLLL